MKENLNNNMVSAIAAMDEKRGIGKGNDLLFKIPEDFARMRGLTSGHPLIMGRATFESIGRVLPGRKSFVVTRDKNYKIPFVEPEGASVEVVHSLEEALLKAQDAPGSDEIFIFGGGQLFKEAIEKGVVDKLYLTKVNGDYGADTFFPEYEEQFTKVVNEEEGESDGYKYKFEDREKQAA